MFYQKNPAIIKVALTSWKGTAMDRAIDKMGILGYLYLDKLFISRDGLIP